MSVEGSHEEVEKYRYGESVYSQGRSLKGSAGSNQIWGVIFFVGSIILTWLINWAGYFAWFLLLGIPLGILLFWYGSNQSKKADEMIARGRSMMSSAKVTIRKRTYRD